MDFLNKTKDSLALAGKGVAHMASDVSGIAKYTVKVKEGERKLDNLYLMLGQRFAEECSAKVVEWFPEIANEIGTVKAEIAENKMAIATLKGNKICPNCGMEVASNVAECPGCGTNVANVITSVIDQEES